MKYGYLNKINSAQEFQKYITLFQQKEVPLENIIINTNFDKFAESLNQGDQIVVHSYIGLFPSLTSYLKTTLELIDKNITIESILEPNICIDNNNIQLIRELTNLNQQLRTNTTPNSTQKRGRPTGATPTIKKKVAQTEKLRQKANISVAEACRITGCQAKTYYRLTKLETKA